MLEGLAEFHGPVAEGEKGEITAAADVFSGMDAGAALTDDDASRGYEFSGVCFDAEHLGLTVATVAAA